MAVLFEATHPGPDFPLLLKAPRLAEGEDPAAIVSFEMEQMILPRLSGPACPALRRRRRLRRPALYRDGAHRRPEPAAADRAAAAALRAVADIGARVADALDALHRQNVVHLDIKPSNVLTRPTGEAVLIDFGLSHHAQLPDLMEEEFRLPYGTAPYMAPEQIMGIRQRTAQRPLRARRDALLLHDGRAALRRSAAPGRPEAAHLARPASAEAPAPRLPGLAAGDHPALPGSAARPPPPDRARNSPSTCAIPTRSR